MSHLRRLTALLLAGLLIAPPAPASELLRQAAELIRAGHPEQALQMFRAAAERGDANGHYGLGVLYYQATGVPGDMIKSTRHFLQAAREGHVLAQYSLGNAYINGRGVQLSPGQAEYWWRKAAARGYVRAQYNLGILLLEQAARAQQREQGIAWLRAAAQGGFAAARDRLAELGEPIRYADIQAQPQRQPLRDESRLLSLKDDTYVIQLLSSAQADSAERFIQEHALEGRVLRFRFPLRGSVWNGLAYDGAFDSAADAYATIKDLQNALDDAEPWLRPVAEVQQQIRQARQETAAQLRQPRD